MKKGFFGINMILNQVAMGQDDSTAGYSVTERLVANMKGSSMNTHMGNIIIDNEVIAQYAGSVAVECFGIVGMAGINVKDGLVRLLKMDSLTRGINVTLSNHKLILDFHVIVAYGVSIIAVADNLISNVKYKVEEFTGIGIEKINIFVDGVRVID